MYTNGIKWRPAFDDYELVTGLAQFSSISHREHLLAYSYVASLLPSSAAVQVRVSTDTMSYSYIAILYYVTRRRVQAV